MLVDLTEPEFRAAIPILQRIEEAGFEAYFVGGCVRDALLGLPIHDVDIASSAYPEEIKRIFKRTIDTGIQHGTVMVMDHGTGYEVTTFRTESGYQDFRRPDKVTFVRSLKEDQLRRDFTINALAATHDGKVIDNFGGLADLNAKQLRAVGNAQDRFREDALRMMRAVRFESQLGFSLEPATRQALADNAPLLQHIATERIAAEFTRLLTGNNWVAGVQSMVAAGLHEFCPGLAGRKEGLLQFAARTDRPYANVLVAWTVLIQTLALPSSQFLKTWKQANDLISTVSRAEKLLAALLSENADNQTLFDAGPVGVQTAMSAIQHLQPDFPTADWTERYSNLPIHKSEDLALTGKMLIDAGMTPGPQLGKVLSVIRAAVIAGELPNDGQNLLTAARELK